MTKKIIGALVGGTLIFIWQFLSWTVLDLHRPQQMYTPYQDTIRSFLSERLASDGGFYIPTLPQGAGSEENDKLYQENLGKPWIQIFYHQSLKDNMVRNMIRGLLTNILMVWLFVWLLSKISKLSWLTVWLAALAVGLIVFLQSNYTTHIWFETFDLYAQLTDALVSWGLTGLWLGWWLNRKAKY